MAISGDGQQIISGSNGRTLGIWDMQIGQYVGESLRGHADRVNCLAISSGGRRVFVQVSLRDYTNAGHQEKDVCWGAAPRASRCGDVRGDK